MMSIIIITTTTIIIMVITIITTTTIIAMLVPFSVSGTCVAFLVLLVFLVIVIIFVMAIALGLGGFIDDVFLGAEAVRVNARVIIAMGTAHAGDPLVLHSIDILADVLTGKRSRIARAGASAP